MQTDRGTTDTTNHKPKALTLTQIRKLSNSCQSGSFRQILAESMTIEDSDQEELAALAAYKAIYRWSQDHYDLAAPAEHLVERLIFHISISPLTAANVESITAEAEDHFESREEVVATLREEECLRSRRRDREVDVAAVDGAAALN